MKNGGRARARFWRGESQCVPQHLLRLGRAIRRHEGCSERPAGIRRGRIAFDQTVRQRRGLIEVAAREVGRCKLRQRLIIMGSKRQRRPAQVDRLVRPARLADRLGKVDEYPRMTGAEPKCSPQMLFSLAEIGKLEQRDAEEGQSDRMVRLRLQYRLE